MTAQDFLNWCPPVTTALCGWFLYEFVKETKLFKADTKKTLTEFEIERANFNSAISSSVFQLKTLNTSLTTNMLALRNELNKLKITTDGLHVKASDCDRIFRTCLEVAKAFNDRVELVEKDVKTIKIQVLGKK